MNLFGEEDPPPPVEQETEPQPVPRRPGWVLVSTKNGPQGYHRIKTRGTLSSLVTVCGITGHKVEEHQRSIIECSGCKP